MRSLVSKSTSYLPSFFFTLMLSACGGGGGGDSQSLAVNSDRDSDGVLNSLDVFPDNASESLDTDSDGVGNNADTDDDGDGVADTEDIFPLDSSESRDTDSDGVGNNADDDDDNDGVLDSEDIFPLNSSESRDTDSDGLGNNGDDDDDNDGVSDSLDAFPLDANESVDSDGDGVGNNADTDDDNDGVEDVSDDFPEDETRSATPTISLTVLEENAYEANNQLGKFQIQRTGDPMELDIVFQISGNEDSTRGSVSDVDFSLSYGNGDGVGTTLKLAENQNFRVIEVLATQDGLKEVPETLTLTLKLDEGYELGTDVAGSVIISDASNAPENGRVFLGTFGPQDAADTTASGLLSFVLQGDNDGGVLNYNFSNLGSIRTDQHIHMLPSGTIVRDIEESLLDEDGHLSSFTWDMAPGGIYTTEQQVLDALFDGKFYINIHTADYPNGEISATLVFDANVNAPTDSGGGEITSSASLTKTEVDSDVVRFLNQSTFGSTERSYNELRATIEETGENRMVAYESWIDSQFEKPQTEMLALMDETIPLFLSCDITRNAGCDNAEPEENLRRDAFWPMAVYGRDQLRQRMTFALSEILVVSDQDAGVRNGHRGAADYWDTLAENAFGTYRQLLGDVTRHPIMGLYLSHLRNKKEDPAKGTYPDENYAREVMQLFTFGLVHRQKNGSIKLGENNLPIETYDNSVISELARVMTGLSFSKTNNGSSVIDNTNFSRGNSFNNSVQHRWTHPMKFFTAHHDFGEKILFEDGGETQKISASSSSSLSAANEELEQVLDYLVGHGTTAPFIARKLIQRFVTSNPSPGYIERVATSFGEQGDLRAVIKAILLDPEARNPATIHSLSYGKFKEPVLHLTSLLRLLRAGSEIPLGESNAIGYDAIPGVGHSKIENFESEVTLMRIGNMQAIGQEVLRAPSVFNFFSPDFAPTGPIASGSLVSPELQLVTESQIFNTFNIFSSLVSSGGLSRSNRYTNFNLTYTRDQFRVKLNDDVLDSVWDSTSGTNLSKAKAVVRFLDFYLNAGQLTNVEQDVNAGSETDSFTDLLAQRLSTYTNSMNRNRLAVYTMMTAPDVQIGR
ncbi:MAG: hypothetical protein CBC09_01485 [Cellvibrionales bacterium TMED49]|nr:hypothetical protein [Porticoccaceae bacterium]OUU39792.1 MAG: hypothetical protein CBC09_01485 [Cellvibrionales bacterium TMED49]